jgi:hypothetical protein
MQTAFNIYENFPMGNYQIHKTTRAGCTTALVAESLNRDENFLCVVPTNWIADKTVVVDSKKYSDVGSAEVIHIPANHECLINKQLCEDCPDLKQLPILPLAGSCSKCAQSEQCEVTAVLRKPDAKGYVVTYKKIAALMMASVSRPNTQAGQVLEVLNNVKNLILDEIHDIQFTESTSFTVYDDHVFNRVNLEKYIPMMSNFTYMCRVITQFNFIMGEQKIKNSIHEVLGGAQDEDYWKHHLNISLKNPSPGIVDGENETKVIVGAYNEIIELTTERKMYNLEMRDILDLYDMMSIVMSDVIAITAIREQGIIKINLAAIDQTTTKMIQSYTMSMQSENRRIFLTSATICSYDYGKMFMGGLKPKKVSFGIGGDPMSTNSKMLILADSKKYHVIGRNSTYNKQDEIIERIIKILDMYGDSDCIIIVLNPREAMKLEAVLKELGHPHKVTYYKAPEMMGVSSDARVMIAIGIANKPSNAFDVVTTNTVESKRMLYESVHCDTWQAWSRVKDPAGKVPSVIFALGCTVEECEAITTWGYNRTVEVSPYTERQKKTIKVKCENGIISSPLIRKCKNFDEMTKEGSLHKLCKVSPEKSENLLIYYIIRRFCKKTGETLHSSTGLIKRVLNRPDAYALQNSTVGYYKVKSPVSDITIQKHLSGSLTIGAYQFNPENQVKWVCFDIDSHAPKNVVETEDDIKARDEKAETDMKRMCNFFKISDVPFLLEKSGSPHSYHIWVFVNPVDGMKAKQFGIDVKKETGIDCEVFPKQAQIGKDGYGNLVKVPLATHQIHKTHSEILVNGEFVRDFKDLKIEILDLSNYPVPEKKTIATVKSKPVLKVTTPKVKGYNVNVRPCVMAALKMQLTDGGGHILRVAIAREFHEAGLDAVSIAKLFRGQADYDFAYSLKMVHSVIDIPGKRVRCDTLRQNSPKFIQCEGCENLGRW